MGTEDGDGRLDTGFLQPVHRLARKAHAIGARIVVDGAQLAAHRRIDVKPDHSPEHLDYVVLSAHKMYAPFGTGALIGRRDTFEDGPPEHQGGGTVDIVTPEEVSWAELPDREEAGSPNVIGAVAMAVAAQTLMRIDMDSVTRHEQMLTAYALEQLRSVPGITLYGATGAGKTDDRLGVIPFNLHSLPHALVAAILGYEGGIGVRSGCFCAQSYVSILLRRDPSELGSGRGEGSRHAQAWNGAGQPGPVQHARRRRRPRGDAEADCGRRPAGPV